MVPIGHFSMGTHWPCPLQHMPLSTYIRLSHAIGNPGLSAVTCSCKNTFSNRLTGMQSIPVSKPWLWWSFCNEKTSCSSGKPFILPKHLWGCSNATHKSPVYTVDGTRLFQNSSPECLIFFSCYSESMKNVSKSWSKSETRASTKSSTDGRFWSIPKGESGNTGQGKMDFTSKAALKWKEIVTRRTTPIQLSRASAKKHGIRLYGNWFRNTTWSISPSPLP